MLKTIFVFCCVNFSFLCEARGESPFLKEGLRENLFSAFENLLSSKEGFLLLSFFALVGVMCLFSPGEPKQEI